MAELQIFRNTLSIRIECSALELHPMRLSLWAGK